MNVRRRAREVDVTVITGLSGAGRSEAAKALEDLGWFVIDNLPPALISKMLSLALAPGNDIKRIALVIDARGGTFFGEATNELEKLRRDTCNFRMVFLEASDDSLVRTSDLNCYLLFLGFVFFATIVCARWLRRVAGVNASPPAFVLFNILFL